MSDCSQTTSIAVDYSTEYNQTTETTTTTSTDEYSNHNPESTRTPRNVIKFQNSNEPTPAPKTTEGFNKDNQPFENPPTVSKPDLPLGTTTTISSKEKQDSCKVDQKSQPAVIENTDAAKLTSKESKMHHQTGEEEEKKVRQKPTKPQKEPQQ